MGLCQKRVFLHIPDVLETNNVGFLAGCVKKDKSSCKFYITSDKLQDNLKNCIGYCGLSSLEGKINDWLHLTFSYGKFKLTKVSCDGFTVDLNKVVCIFYNYKSFRFSDAAEDDISKALREVNGEQYKKKRFKMLLCGTFLSAFGVFTKVCAGFFPYFSFSSSAGYVHRSSSLTRDLLQDYMSAGSNVGDLQVLSAVFSKLFDVSLGLLVWLCCLRLVNESAYAGATIDFLRDLLEYLMDSPVGLKLNDAFNKVLGKFFIYHMVLWRTFLGTVAQLIQLQLLLPMVLIGGFTFQTALAADLLGLATFHVHCIYVYAARLYGAQIHALTSLCRLFLGRKYNPLKNRVDSYNYTNHQLFVGTLAFTVLLFLLPTTALYYIVFTSLRLLLVGTFSTLQHAGALVQRFPAYQLCLWLVNSTKVHRNVHMRVLQTDSASLCLYADLRASPWPCGLRCEPPLAQTKPSWTSLLPKVVSGQLV